MTLELTASVADELPSTLKTALAKMETNHQQVFEEDYVRKRRTPILMLLLAIFLPIQHFLEGRVGMGILFWITFGGFGIWWIIDIIMVWGRTKRHNEEVGKTILRDMKMMNS